MSGCCGQGPVIVSGAAATPRVDVETVLLCDVLPDGTVAGVALTEGIYDTISGARVGTRTVDPATGDPYTPTGTLGPCSPDGCNATTTALVLCDTATDGTATTFVRTTTYDCEGAILGTLDRDLDGAAYTPAGTVGVCPAVPDCESPTTPTATIGLCLPDGTPIAVTVVRDCEGVVTSEGWINLTSGAFSAGAPPVGTVACGDSRSVQVSGTFCDVDGAGEVVGLVLIEYSYAADGAIDSVRLVDAATGDTYVPVGEITTCPAGTAQPEQDIVQLCDVAGDGTSTPFVRDYRRDELGAISGHSDYLLDGTAYVPTGTVGVCVAPCRTTSTQLLCDKSDTAPPLPATLSVVTTDPTPYFFTGHNAPFQGNPQDLWDGGTLAVPADPNSSATGLPQVHRCMTGIITADAPPCDDGTATVTAQVTVRNTGPNASTLTSGRLRLLTVSGAQLANNPISNVSVNGTRTMAVSANVTPDQLTNGQLVVWLDLETWDSSGSSAPPKGWEAYNFAVSAEFGQSGCIPPVEFFRTTVRDCATGETLSTADSTLDGDPYTVTGTPGFCEPTSEDPELCASSTTLTLCDTTPVDAGDLVTATVTDPTPYFQTGDGVTKRVVLVDPQPFFDGSPITVDGPPGGETTADPTHRYTAAVLALPEDACPPCGDWPDTLTLTVAATATNNGPAVGQGVTGRFTLFNGLTVIGTNQVTATPVGGVAQFTVTADVARAALLAGTVVIVMDLETKHQGLKAWTAQDFAVSLEFEQTGCGNPFLRTILRDCTTGDLVDVLNTDYEGQPYTPVGEVGPCTERSTCGGQSGGSTACEQCTPLVLCDVLPSGDTVSFLRTVCHNCTGGVIGVEDTALDGVTAYTVAGTVRDCGVVGDCPTSYSTECWSAASAQASYDNTRGNCGGIDPGSMGTCAGNWRISSWIIDGAEQITGAPAQFVANGCGGAAGQFHAEWATALGVIDPSSTWEPAYNGTCLFFIRTSSMDPDRVYGQMTVYRTEAPTQVYTLTPVASRTEVSFTKRFTQECDGTTSVTWLDADGVEIEEPEGDLTFCGATDPTDPTDPDAEVVSTGVRAVTGTAPQDLVAEFAGLQSISLAVLAGTVEVTVTDGTAVAIPAGVTLTWSVAKDTDTALAAASFAGADASASYLLNWTYLS